MTNEKSLAPTLIKYYERLFKAVGPRGWWPAETPFEVIIGAILTQNTAWKNVEKAIHNLKDAGVLSPEGLREIDPRALARLIRPSGYYRQKAKKIKRFVKYLWQRYNGSLEAMEEQSTDALREELLRLNGIGPETADSILLYALGRASFVVDTYTRRILSRHGLVEEGIRYEALRRVFMENLPADVGLYNEYHALLDYVGHHFCRKTPLCQKCPLEIYLLQRPHPER